MNTRIKYTLILSCLFGFITPTLANTTFSSDDQKKIDYLVEHPEKLEKYESLPDWKKKKALEKFDLTEDEIKAAEDKVATDATKGTQ